MKQIYKLLENIESKIEGDCITYITKTYKVITIGVGWDMLTAGANFMEHHFSEKELNTFDNEEFINKFVEEANKFYHKNMAA